MICSKKLDFPLFNNQQLNNNNNNNSHITIQKALEYIENRIYNTWVTRKLFLEELIKLDVAIIEYDAIDFSYISLVRLILMLSIFII
jgi:hypothetical protein